MKRPEVPTFDQWEDAKTSLTYYVLKPFVDEATLRIKDHKFNGGISATEQDNELGPQKIKIIISQIFQNSYTQCDNSTYSTSLSSDEIIAAYLGFDLDQLRSEQKIMDEYIFQMSLRGQKFKVISGEHEHQIDDQK